MLEFSAVKTYPDFKLDATFSGGEGMVTALFGKSGSGKTSIINMAAGLTEPDNGRIAINNRTLYDSGSGVNIPPRRRNAGYIFQDGRLFPHFTVERNLRYGMGKGSDSSYFDEIVGLLGIDDLLHRRPHKLSGGEKQRVAIGRALLSSPDFLLMDEPLSALDNARKQELIPFITRMVDRFRIPVIYVTHSRDELLRICDNVVLMSRGSCIDSGSVEEVVSRPENMEFLGLQGRISVIRGEAYEGSRVLIENGRLKLPSSKYTAGTPMRAALHSDDITVAVKKPEGLSARNILKCRVIGMDETADGAVSLELDAGINFYATITRQAVSELGIENNMEIYAILKTIALSRLSVPVSG
ncbi:molybdenum ABC transporter ATP-binding protein [Limisalsivibrio acetivorans]|uniref:molybdenum ABC transporter ATP-binding protein n=1 Tax=Limisalsivibrio acetivorans TaxID=1304888 RepID=UPI0003B4FB42|nr:molybdenum ABC transporter ATP-binding protein [Limisalsivibrio acetivorans]